MYLSNQQTKEGEWMSVVRRKIVSGYLPFNSINLFDVKLECGHEGVAQGRIRDENGYLLIPPRMPKTSRCTVCEDLKGLKDAKEGLEK